jgi:hypothetical protein
MLNKFIPVILMTLFGIVISKYAQAETMREDQVRNDDCLSCHSPNNSLGIRDFSKVYESKKELHRMGGNYPLDAIARENFNVPDMQCNNLVYFDGNNNGQPDTDEVRVYEVDGVPTVTCSSCHREHESSLVAVDKPDEGYLRGTMATTDLCLACHRQ